MSQVPHERPALLVSACLLGTPCNHEGGHSRRPAVVALGETHRLVPICPEVCGTAAVYDGSFTHTLRPGEGTTAEVLRAAGIEVISDEELT